MKQLAAVVTWSESCELKLNNPCGDSALCKRGGISKKLKEQSGKTT